MGWTKLNPAKVVVAIGRITGGEAVADVARDYGVDPMTLHRHMKRRGYQKVGRGKRSIKTRIPTDTTTLAYLAGFVDGEGSFGKRRSFDGGYWFFAITNTDEGVMRWLSELLNHPLTVRQRFCPKHTDVLAKVQYDLAITNGLGVYRLATALLPFLKTKADKARECINDLSGRIAFKYCDNGRTSEPLA